jgi:hypothetical protein
MFSLFTVNLEFFRHKGVDPDPQAMVPPAYGGNKAVLCVKNGVKFEARFITVEVKSCQECEGREKIRFFCTSII